MKPLDKAFMKIEKKRKEDHLKNKEYEALAKPVMQKIVKILQKQMWHEAQVKIIQEDIDGQLSIMQNFLDLMNTKGHELYLTSTQTLEVKQKIYHGKAEITDPKKFMAYLKKYCTPDEVITLLTPPTTLKELRKFLDKHIEKYSHDIFHKIDGVEKNDAFITIKAKIITKEI